MNANKKLLVGVLLFVLTLTFSIPLQVFAYTAEQINQNRSTNKYAFIDTNASEISMKIGVGNNQIRELRFKRNPQPPQQGSGLAGAAIPLTYVYELQGNTDDGCRQGVIVEPVQSLGAPQVASIKVPAANIDTAPDPDKIDATLTFFRKDGDRCTNRDIESQIQVNNPFDAKLAVPAAERAAGPGQEGAGENISCESTDSGPLGWILCPIIELAASFTQFVFENFVRPFLEDVPVSANEGEGTYEAWKNFRLIGNIVLVGTMVAVVYAQVRGDR